MTSQGLYAKALLAELNGTEREEVLDAFKEFAQPVGNVKGPPNDKEWIQFLVGSYPVGGYGLNLQENCHINVMK